MHGLTVRWSLEDAPDGVEEALSTYVRDTSLHQEMQEQSSMRISSCPSFQLYCISCITEVKQIIQLCKRLESPANATSKDYTIQSKKIP